MIFIGDIHGMFNYYTDVVKNITHTPTVQVGDFGIGFPGYVYPPKIDGNHWFIRGNHDNPAEVRVHPNYLGDYGYNEKLGIFYVGGADSIDKHMRVEGVSWWRDEELNYTTFNTKVLPLFEKIRPRVVVTHTCPLTIKRELIGNREWGSGKASVTEHALQAMFEIHQPDVWVFGHFHVPFKLRRNGTRFICLNTYQLIEIEDL